MAGVDDARALVHPACEGDRWLVPASLGSAGLSGPAVTGWAPDRIEVLAVFPDGALWNRYWDGSDWHAWESLGGEIDPLSAPAASSWGDARAPCSAPPCPCRRPAAAPPPAPDPARPRFRQIELERLYVSVALEPLVVAERDRCPDLSSALSGTRPSST